MAGRRGQFRRHLTSTELIFVSFLACCVHVVSGGSCDRARSRVARKYLESELYTKVEERGYQLPKSCPFAKENDMYLDNELHKKEARFGNWRCLYCNKVFKSEAYLELHIENRHPGTIKRDGVCLADYCDVLECDLHSTLFQPGRTGESLQCNSIVMERRRHRCHMVLDQCFPPHGSQVATTLHHDFEHLYCEHLTCDEVAVGAMRARQPSTALMQAARARADSSETGSSRTSGWQKLGVVLAVLFLLLLFIFYLGVYLYRKDSTFVSDLRKLSHGRRQKRMELLKSKQF